MQFSLAILSLLVVGAVASPVPGKSSANPPKAKPVQITINKTSAGDVHMGEVVNKGALEGDDVHLGELANHGAEKRDGDMHLGEVANNDSNLKALED